MKPPRWEAHSHEYSSLGSLQVAPESLKDLPPGPFALAGPGCGWLNQAVPLTQGEQWVAWGIAPLSIGLCVKLCLESTLLYIGEETSKALQLYLGLQLYAVG